ncbi:unnamed protein product [Prorocentrum cordatum]|uniref:Uncharacterized protein n=1 Tax=Prorocentrum cordatum TaxID=2364126 RepID=A0ABN9W1J4_9DINO|nr:unnamed protein product [Polarella glacialis]
MFWMAHFTFSSRLSRVCSLPYPKSSAAPRLARASTASLPLATCCAKPSSLLMAALDLWAFTCITHSGSSPTSAILCQILLQTSACGLPQLKHHLGPLLMPSRMPWWSVKILHGGSTVSKVFKKAHISALLTVFCSLKRHGRGPQSCTVGAPPASMAIAAHPACAQQLVPSLEPSHTMSPDRRASAPWRTSQWKSASSTDLWAQSAAGPHPMQMSVGVMLTSASLLMVQGHCALLDTSSRLTTFCSATCSCLYCEMTWVLRDQGNTPLAPVLLPLVLLAPQILDPQRRPDTEGIPEPSTRLRPEGLLATGLHLPLAPCNEHSQNSSPKAAKPSTLSSTTDGKLSTIHCCAPRCLSTCKLTLSNALTRSRMAVTVARGSLMISHTLTRVGRRPMARSTATLFGIRKKMTVAACSGQTSVRSTSLRICRSVQCAASEAPCSMAGCQRSTPCAVFFLKVRATFFNLAKSSSVNSGNSWRGSVSHRRSCSCIGSFTFQTAFHSPRAASAARNGSSVIPTGLCGAEGQDSWMGATSVAPMSLIESKPARTAGAFWKSPHSTHGMLSSCSFPNTWSISPLFRRDICSAVHRYTSEPEAEQLEGMGACRAQRVASGQAWPLARRLQGADRRGRPSARAHGPDAAGDHAGGGPRMRVDEGGGGEGGWRRERKDPSKESQPQKCKYIRKKPVC